jgi:hypothetical protein
MGNHGPYSDCVWATGVVGPAINRRVDAPVAALSLHFQWRSRRLEVDGGPSWRRVPQPAPLQFSGICGFGSCLREYSRRVAAARLPLPDSNVDASVSPERNQDEQAVPRYPEVTGVYIGGDMRRRPTLGKQVSDPIALTSV